MEMLTPIYGGLLGGPWIWTAAVLAAVVVALGYHGAPLTVWLVGGLLLLLGIGAPVWLLAAALAVALIVGVPPFRRRLLIGPLMRLLTGLKVLPAISATERVALDAGTTWVDAEYFSGKPDFNRILGERYPTLSREEQAFVDGPVETLCGMVDDWEVHCRRDFPPEVWDYLKHQRFFGMIIPRQYGGLGFSALAHSAVITKIASRSIPLAVTTMVPNSLGPAELLLHYGTDEQKTRYLPRLAVGEEVPCFALTEPDAGSDAGAISSVGELFRDADGELCVRLTWRKRYITLAAIATVLGLAFKLRDPDELLGRGKDLGITCALIPTDAAGVRLGRRHDPLGIPFYNCPTEGTDVVIPANQIIGGIKGAGNGWRMLMECLAAGRAISLPALSTGTAQCVSRVAGSYAVVRRQFGLSIGRFEGVGEKLAEIAGLTYLLDAARVYTAGAVDGGAKPSVVSALAKYNFTELSRRIVNHGMDILGGAAISQGPRNLLANKYVATPISITVEGANILTRTMIVFGQGVIRCHPYAQREVDALAAGDVAAFDEAFCRHVGFTLRNAFRATLLTLTRGRLARVPGDRLTRYYARRLTWGSATFAALADIALGAYGGQLKRRESLTGRFADILSWLYLGSATLRRYQAEGCRAADRPLVHWALRHSLAEAQAALDGILANIRVPGLTWLLRGPVAWWYRLSPLGTAPTDALNQTVASAMQHDGDVRAALAGAIYLPSADAEPLAALCHAYDLAEESDPVMQTLKAAVRRRDLPQAGPAAVVREAVERGIISLRQSELVQQAEAARQAAIPDGGQHAQGGTSDDQETTGKSESVARRSTDRRRSEQCADRCLRCRSAALQGRRRGVDQRTPHRWQAVEGSGHPGGSGGACPAVAVHWWGSRWWGAARPVAAAALTKGQACGGCSAAARVAAAFPARVPWPRVPFRHQS
jgi:acyl-CoA dehydrogenase